MNTRPRAEDVAVRVDRRVRQWYKGVRALIVDNHRQARRPLVAAVLRTCVVSVVAFNACGTTKTRFRC